VKYAKEVDAIESLLKIAFEIVSPVMSVQHGHVVSTPRIHEWNLAPQSLAAKGFAGQFREGEHFLRPVFGQANGNKG